MGGAVLAGFLSARALPWAVILAVVFWPIRWLAFRQWTRRTPLDWPILILMLLAPVTLWATALPDVTWPQVYRLLGGIGLYYALVNFPVGWPSTTNFLAGLRWMAIGVGLATLGLCVFAVVSVDWVVAGKLPFIPASLYALFPHLAVDTANPNVMAGSILILLVVLLGLLLFAGRGLRVGEYLLYGAACAAGVAILVLTQSRGAVLALGLVGLLLVALRWRWGWLMMVLGVVCLLIALKVVGTASFINLLVSNATLGGVDGRAEVWSRAIYMIQDFPFTGVGMGSYMQVADTFYPFSSYPPGKVPHAHNLLLQIGVDLGIPGLIAWLSAWMLVTLMAWRVYRSGSELQNSWLAGWGVGLFACQVALLAHGMVDAVTWGMVRPAPLVWALWGVVSLTWLGLSERARAQGMLT